MCHRRSGAPVTGGDGVAGAPPLTRLATLHPELQAGLLQEDVPALARSPPRASSCPQICPSACSASDGSSPSPLPNPPAGLGEDPAPPRSRPTRRSLTST